MMMAAPEDQARLLHKQLEVHAGVKLQLKINNNRSTMLSVKWEPDCTKVSLHQMFLQAPYNIMQELAYYLRGDCQRLTPSVRAYIETNLRHLDYSYQLDLRKLDTRGQVYDLQKIYQDLNREYFNNQLQLYITWFGKRRRSRSNRMILGLYQDPLRLIKINRLLDDVHFPEYYVAFIVYHEMVHHVCPSYVDEKGIKHIHGKAFKEREKQFKYYSLAKQWVRDNQECIFHSYYL